MKCKQCGTDEDRVHGFCSCHCEELFGKDAEIASLKARVEELEDENKNIKEQWEFAVSERIELVAKMAVLVGAAEEETQAEMEARSAEQARARTLSNTDERRDAECVASERRRNLWRASKARREAVRGRNV